MRFCILVWIIFADWIITDWIERPLAFWVLAVGQNLKAIGFWMSAVSKEEKVFAICSKCGLLGAAKATLVFIIPGRCPISNILYRAMG